MDNTGTVGADEEFWYRGGVEGQAGDVAGDAEGGQIDGPDQGAGGGVEFGYEGRVARADPQVAGGRVQGQAARVLAAGRQRGGELSNPRPVAGLISMISSGLVSRTYKWPPPDGSYCTATTSRFCDRLSVAATTPSAGLMAMIRSGLKFQLLTNRCPAGTATPLSVIPAGRTCRPVPLAPLPGIGQLANVSPVVGDTLPQLAGLRRHPQLAIAKAHVPQIAGRRVDVVDRQRRAGSAAGRDREVARPVGRQRQMHDVVLMDAAAGDVRAGANVGVGQIVSPNVYWLPLPSTKPRPRSSPNLGPSPSANRPPARLQGGVNDEPTTDSAYAPLKWLGIWTVICVPVASTKLGLRSCDSTIALW